MIPGIAPSRRPILVGSDPTEVICAGTLAESTFRFALCTCEEYAGSTTLTTDSFDSTSGPATSGDNGGSVGINGRFITNGDVSIGGSLWVGSPLGIQAGGGDIFASGELHDQGPVQSGARVEIGHDAFVGGNTRARELTVGGTLTLPEGASAQASPMNVGSVAHASVTVAPPCACDADELVDIAGFVDHYHASNDNAAIALDPAALSAYTGTTVLDLSPAAASTSTRSPARGISRSESQAARRCSSTATSRRWGISRSRSARAASSISS